MLVGRSKTIYTVGYIRKVRCPMQKFSRSSLRFIIALLILVGASVPRQYAVAGGTVGNGTPASCTEAAFNTALSGGGTITFNCGAGSKTILLTTEKTITQNTTINGGKKITLSAGGGRRIFLVSSGVSFNLTNLSLTQGKSILGGAIYNDGNMAITNSTIFSNNAPGSLGGAIYNSVVGVLTITGSVLSGNAASNGSSGGI